MLAAVSTASIRARVLGPPSRSWSSGAAGSSVTKPLPVPLSEALRHLEDDDVITDALGGELWTCLRSAKTWSGRRTGAR